MHDGFGVHADTLGRLVDPALALIDIPTQEQSVTEMLCDALHSVRMHLGMDVVDWPPENIEDLAKRFDDQF